MSVFALGLNHASAPLALRERLAFGAEALKGPLHQLKTRLGGGEAALLSTCNRTELYVAGPAEWAQPSLNFLADTAGMDAAALSTHTYLHRHGDAARHDHQPEGHHPLAVAQHELGPAFHRETPQ